MKFARVICAIGAALLPPALRADAVSSDSAFVFLRPETSSFWRTAEDPTITVPVVPPDGATSATLTVSGAGYNKSYADVTAGEFSFNVPQAAGPESENVYDLTLSFDDGTTRTARIGVVQGVGTTGASARCVLRASSKKWRRVERRAVVPIPDGTESLTIDGETTCDLGLDGCRGWHLVDGFALDVAKSLDLCVGGSHYLADLLGGVPGLMFIVR